MFARLRYSTFSPQLAQAAYASAHDTGAHAFVILPSISVHQHILWLIYVNDLEIDGFAHLNMQMTILFTNQVFLGIRMI